MTLYIDSKLNFTDSNVVSTLGSWHPSLPLLALGSYNQEKGGFVTIFHENGLALEGCEWPILLSNQVTAMAWHPTRKLLVVGWDGGELYIWLEYSWARLEAPHNAALTTVAFSLGGGRLLAADAAGSLSGWQSASGAPLTSFHHQLGDVITHVTFCPVRPTGETSIRGLARAAVAGDENALDALAAWRPRTTARMREGSQPDNHACYAAQDNGAILYIDHAGSCSEVLNAPGNIIFMGMISNVYLLIAWENGGALSLTRFITSDDGNITTDTHVRMAARNGQAIVLTGNYCVAVITGDNLIRVWDSENGDNDVLPNENDEVVAGDIFTSISYCNLSDTLCCGTSQGNLYFWRRDHRNHWKLISSTSIKGTVKEVSWGSEGLMNPLLHVNCITSVFILREQPVCWGYTPNVWMVQKSAYEIAITNKMELTASIKTQVTVRAFAFKDQYVALGDGKEVQLYIKSGAVASAIRVAAEASAWHLVWRAGSASTTHALHAATILETAEQSEQAIALYQKAGKPHMALRLALGCGDTSAMLAAVESLGERVEPSLARKLAAHLRRAEHHSHAAALLATAGEYEEALDIVEQSSAPLTEELAERLAAPAGAAGRDALLRRLADVLGARGLYHHAAKRLASTGDKAGAMRWLMRSGDADRIATFAAATRDRAAQLMAADYLRRHAAWRARADLTRHVLHFYTRAKAHGKLAAFYAECAKMEVDEYGNFEKALEALKEATRCLSKTSDPETGSQIMALQEQTTLVKKFLDLKKLLESGETNAGVASGQQLLRALSGRPGLVTEEKVLKLMVEFAPSHPDIPTFEKQLQKLTQQPQEDTQSVDSTDQSIEELI
ncbi:intraflagellar transport protein 140 homolog isoform X2 [Cydia pomonella]|uniref:intraflagellar transport protein 140 homolog isoform X2 n=1 Tax=Cydia pomonella TaxID=82600 RepID=UPI002ADE7DEF|nr:intraflagellar transport protein 140 homolog isoform X2 [Cydia pomonella]